MRRDILILVNILFIFDVTHEHALLDLFSTEWIPESLLTKYLIFFGLGVRI